MQRADRYRTGFPGTCPVGRVEKVLAINCLGCDFRKQDQRLHWRCDHPGYQQAPGIHFCPGCGTELGPWSEANGWEYCGGPTLRCRRDDSERIGILTNRKLGGVHEGVQ